MPRIVTDGAVEMLPEWEQEYDIQGIRINTQFGEKTYLQAVEIDNARYDKIVDETHASPKTVQPSPHRFAEFYKKIAQTGEPISSIHVTSNLCGTYASAVKAVDGMKDQFTVLPDASISIAADLGPGRLAWCSTLWDSCPVGSMAPGSSVGRTASEKRVSNGFTEDRDG